MVSIIMGSQSDWEIMRLAADFLKQMQVPYTVQVISAHRTPELMLDFAKNAHQKTKVIIAGAGGAAHLPGMLASCTALPVIGVPILSSNSLQGWDSLLSIVQMPAGVPVASVGVNSGQNAGILAMQILGTSDELIYSKLVSFKQDLKNKVAQMNENINQQA